MRPGNFSRQYLHLIVFALGISLSWGSCTLRKSTETHRTLSPMDVDASGIGTIQSSLYSVDSIEADTAVLLSRSQPGEVVLVPYEVVKFAQEGDILRATGDPSRPYELEREATFKVRENIAALLEKLTEAD